MGGVCLYFYCAFILRKVNDFICYECGTIENMNKSHLKGKRVTVMGLGLHGGGLGTVRWLLHQGALVTVTDMKTEEELRVSVEKLHKLDGEVRLVLGRHDEADFTEADVVVRNPGVRADSPYLALARKASVPVEMDSSLFFENCPSQHIIGVTGSKGKTTTARAIEHVLKAGERSVVAVGVDGVSPLAALLTGEIDAETIVVFELSSWRLEALAERGLSPSTAVVTSIYREHLNTYDSFEQYIETKKAIWKFQGERGEVLLNADDEVIASWATEVPGKLFWYSLGDQLPGNGVYMHDDSIWIRDEEEKELLPIEQLPVKSGHERRNLLPALLIGWQYGLDAEKLRQAIDSFEPLPHRLEMVRDMDGVIFVNDSAATMPDASMAALDAYAEWPVILIAGGNDKKLDFGPWGKKAANSDVKEIVWLPGTATALMQEAVRAGGGEMIFKEASTMQEAVREAARAANGGGVVLLSPGATSFGSFENEFDRGNKFREAVEKL